MTEQQSKHVVQLLLMRINVVLT